MPARSSSRPDSLRSRLKLWFIDNPGEHRPAEVAPSFPDKSYVRVGAELSRLYKDGVLDRRTAPAPDGVRAKTTSYYRLANTPVPPTTED